METEELKERIHKLENELETTAHANTSILNEMSQRSLELTAKLAEAKASAYQVCEENSELKVTVKELECEIMEASIQFIDHQNPIDPGCSSIGVINIIIIIIIIIILLCALMRAAFPLAIV